MALGFGGQVMAVVPSHNAVIVRLGESRGWDFGQDTNNFVASILRALE
jgi:hypothetical protein